MAQAILLSIEGVLSKGGPPNGQPIDTGMRLFHCLRAQFKVVLSSLCPNEDWIEHWLSVVGIRDLHHFAGEEELEPFEIRMAHLTAARVAAYDMGLVIDADPQVCAEVLRQGVPTLLFSHPRYARPEARPDYDRSLRPWGEIEEEITVQRKHRDHPLKIDAEMEPVE